MPQVFANQHTDPPEPGCLESTEAVAGRKIALLVKQSIRRQIDLPMHVPQFAPLNIGGAVVETKLRRLLDKTKDDIRTVGRLAEFCDFRTIHRKPNVRHHVTQEVAGERQLGKYNQIRTRGLRLFHRAHVHFEIASAIAEYRCNLCQRYPALSSRR